MGTRYADLHLEGSLANVAPLGAVWIAGDVRVLDDDQTPYCVASSDSVLNAVLNDEWDQDVVLDTLP